MIGYLYITGFQNERQFHLIYCLTELKLDPKENNMIEMKSTFPFSTLSLSPPPILDSMMKEVFFFCLLFIQKSQEHSWKTFQTEIQMPLPQTSCARQSFTAVIANV